jgi:hypothetical protein
MNRLEKIILGLEIVNRYRGDICAEHDTIFICCDTEPTVEELVQLEEAGWRPGDDMNSWEHFV